MLVSTKGRYALRVLADMAAHQGESYVALKEIALRQEISEKYLESIVKVLVKGGVLSGVRGKGGGYHLRKPPDQCTVGSVLRLTEGSLAPVACLEEGGPPAGRTAGEPGKDHRCPAAGRRGPLSLHPPFSGLSWACPSVPASGKIEKTAGGTPG